jgi:hypothetical protein
MLLNARLVTLVTLDTSGKPEIPGMPQTEETVAILEPLGGT